MSVVGKFTVVLLLLIAFSSGLGVVLYLALRSPEVKVPEIVGKDYSDGEKDLALLELKIRKRTDRFSQEKPNTILEQIPLPGDTVKAGQTISVVISRAQAEGDEKPAEVKKETADKDKPKGVDEPTEVDKARAKRKAANKNINANKNANGNLNSNSAANSNANSGSGGNNNSGNSNVGNSSPANINRSNSNARTNSNNAGNANNRPASNSSTRGTNPPPPLIINRNNNRRPQ